MIHLVIVISDETFPGQWRHLENVEINEIFTFIMKYSQFFPARGQMNWKTNKSISYIL